MREVSKGEGEEEGEGEGGGGSAGGRGRDERERENAPKTVNIFKKPTVNPTKHIDYCHYDHNDDDNNNNCTSFLHPRIIVQVIIISIPAF